MGKTWNELTVKLCISVGSYEEEGFFVFEGSKEDLLDHIVDKLIAGRVVTIYAEDVYLKNIKVEPPKVSVRGDKDE